MSKKIECRLPDDLWKDLKEYAGKEGVTVTDIVIAGIQAQIYSRNIPEKPPCQPMAAAAIVDSASLSEGKKPAKTPDKAPEAGKPLANGYIPKSAQELRAAHKLTHPLDICPGCSQFNQGCQCGATVYEPDPVRPAKQPKVSASKAIQPIVKAMLSGIVKQPTASHHPCCNCGVCKPLSDKLSRL